MIIGARVSCGLALLVSAPVVAQGGYDYSPGFEPGPPPEMSALDFWLGNWVTEFFSQSEAGVWVRWPAPWNASTSTGTSVLGGAALIEESQGFPIDPRFAQGHGGREWWQYRATFTYDRFRHLYRAVFLDEITGLMDVYEGGVVRDSLVLTNIGTGTWFPRTGGFQANRIAISKMDGDGFVVSWSFSPLREPVPQRLDSDAVDWIPGPRVVYRRP